MADNQIFRKAGRGYNKEDVNKYIMTLNNDLVESQKRYDKLVNDSNSKAEKDYFMLMDLREKISSIDALKSKIDSLTEENEKLKKQVTELQNGSDTTVVDKNSEAYGNLCTRAGEILVIASTTADDILRKANEEAEKIVGDATAKKDNMLKNISETASTAADGLGDYIRDAVDVCIQKINASIQSVDLLKDSDEEVPLMTFDSASFSTNE